MSKSLIIPGPKLFNYVKSHPRLRFSKTTPRILIHCPYFFGNGWVDEYPEGHYKSFVYFDKTIKGNYVIDQIEPIENIKINNIPCLCIAFIGYSNTNVNLSISEFFKYLDDFQLKIKQTEINFKLQRIDKDF
jgi:hypothetical protein